MAHVFQSLKFKRIMVASSEVFSLKTFQALKQIQLNSQTLSRSRYPDLSMISYQPLDLRMICFDSKDLISFLNFC